MFTIRSKEVRETPATGSAGSGAGRRAGPRKPPPIAAGTGAPEGRTGGMDHLLALLLPPLSILLAGRPVLAAPFGVPARVLSGGPGHPASGLPARVVVLERGRRRRRGRGAGPARVAGAGRRR